MSRILVIGLWLLGLLCRASGAAPNPGEQAPPKLMLWSWYAEDDFRPFAGSGAGVAYLALSLKFERQAEVIPTPREIPVRIPPNMYKMAVVRSDYDTYDAARRPSFSPRQIRRLWCYV